MNMRIMKPTPDTWLTPKMLIVAVALALLLTLAMGLPASEKSDLTKNFRVDSVRLNGIVSDIKISNWDESDVQIRVYNDDPDKPTYSTRIENDQLIIEQQQTASISHGSITVISTGEGARSEVNIGNNGVVISQNGVTVSNSTGDAEASSLEIILPASTTVDLNQFSGHAMIEHLESSLTIAGNGTLAVASLHDADVASRGNASVEVERATGHMQLELRGNTAISINAGEIDDLTVMAADNAGTQINAKAGRVNVEASNNASVRVAEVVDRPTLVQSGNARIDIGNWPQSK